MGHETAWICSAMAEESLLGYRIAGICSAMKEESLLRHKIAGICSPMKEKSHLGHKMMRPCSPSGKQVLSWNIREPVCSPLKVKCPLHSVAGGFFLKKAKIMRTNATFSFSENLCQKSSLLLWAKKIMELEVIKNKIYEIRGQRVMLDRDLAHLYGVETKVLNQAVKRNAERFPEDFMFRLTKEEMNELVTNCDRFEKLKHSSIPSCAFTEQGVAMLSSVLKSATAIQVNIAITRAFVTMRNYVASVSAASAELAEFKEKLMLIEQSCKDNADAVSDLSEDMQKELDDIYLALSQLADRQKNLETYKNRGRIGFK